MSWRNSRVSMTPFCVAVLSAAMALTSIALVSAAPARAG